MINDEKYENLIKSLKVLGSVVIAFSGGVDSTFLMRAAKELYLMKLGFKGVRVRNHGDLARIEVQRQDRKKVCDEKLMDELCEKFRDLGFKYVTLDLQGYKMGSLNE